MNEHAGPASALSVLIVGVFAVLLHDRQPPPKASPPLPNKQVIVNDLIRQPKSPTTPDVSSSRPAKVSATEKPVVRAAEVRKPAEPVTPPTSTARVEKRPDTQGSATPRPSVSTEPPKSVATSPRGPFTVVQAGETLVEVARRIYGTTDAAETLWRANRDQVAMIDSPLTRGTLLRTP